MKSDIINYYFWPKSVTKKNERINYVHLMIPVHRYNNIGWSAKDRLCEDIYIYIYRK